LHSKTFIKETMRFGQLKFECTTDKNISKRFSCNAHSKMNS